MELKEIVLRTEMSIRYQPELEGHALMGLIIELFKSEARMLALSLNGVYLPYGATITSQEGRVTAELCLDPEVNGEYGDEGNYLPKVRITLNHSDLFDIDTSVCSIKDVALPGLLDTLMRITLIYEELACHGSNFKQIK